MKRALNLTLAGLLTFGFLAGQVNGQSVDDVLEMMIKAQGGRAKLAAVKDVTISGVFEMPATGMSSNMTRYQKDPNMLRMDIEVMGMVITQTYDGENAWVLNRLTGAARDMPGEPIFTDYREVDGIVVACNLVIFEGEEEGITLTVTDVKF